MVKPNPTNARRMPHVMNLVDYGYLVTAAVLSFRIGIPLNNEVGAIGFGVLIAFSLFRFSPWAAAESTVLSIVCYLGLGSFMHRVDVANAGFVVIGFAGLGSLVGLLNRHVRHMFRELRRRDNLSRLLAPAIVERVLAAGYDDVLAPVQREVTVVFTDLRDFTTLSESLSPQAVLELLDELFGHLSSVVQRHQGTVNKFLGDGMLAFWGVPTEDERHANKALRAALEMRERLAELNARRAAMGLTALRMGIGVHSGIVAAGMLGGADQHEYTVVGDAVNLASRIEGLTKALGVDILLSARTWELGGDGLESTVMGAREVKGRAEPVTVYALTGLKG